MSFNYNSPGNNIYLETRVAGYPHRMRFKAFNTRYRLIAPFKQLRRAEEQAVEDTKLILQNAQQLKSKFGASTSWALGKRHIFLSEGIRQQLENLRAETRKKAATVIQVDISFSIIPSLFRNINHSILYEEEMFLKIFHLYSSFVEYFFFYFI